MSAAGSQGVLGQMVLRSSTPAPNEKVLRYLQSMTGEDSRPSHSPPRSMLDVQEEYRSSLTRGNGTTTPQQQSRVMSPNPKSNVTPKYSDVGKSQPPRAPADHDDDDADSNIQVGERSDVGQPAREPGPDDEPGPKFPSFGSGPSFGNFGPLPPDDRLSFNQFGGTWNPDWTQIRNEDGSQAPGNTEGRQPSKAGSRPASQVTENGNRPFSPARSKATATEKATAYPPLPDSTMVPNYVPDTPQQWEAPLSPRSRAYSKAPSISPSDSASSFPMKARRPAGIPQSRSPPPASPRVVPQDRAFSPYRQGPTTEDLFYAAARGRALVIPEVEEEKTVSSIHQPTVTPAPPQQPPSPPSERPVSPAPSPPPQPRSPPPAQSPEMRPKSVVSVASSKPASKAPSQAKTQSVVSKQASTMTAQSRQSASRVSQREPSERAMSPEAYDAEEARIVNEALLNAHHHGQTPRTSYYARSIEPELTGHFHDEELCQLLRHENEAAQPEVIKKALRKAIRQRVKKLGMRYDTESIKQYKRSYQDHDHAQPEEYDHDEPPRWASDIKRELVLMQQRIESLGPKIENLRYEQSYEHPQDSRYAYDPNDESNRTPRTQTVNIETQPAGTIADSMWQPEGHSMDEDEHQREFDEMTETPHIPMAEGQTTQTPQRSLYEPSDVGRDDSPGHQVLEEELYKLKQRPAKAGSAVSEARTWNIVKHDDDDDEGGEGEHDVGTIPDTNGDAYDREPSPPLPALPDQEEEDEDQYDDDAPLEQDAAPNRLPPWQNVHGRLLDWAKIWPTSELEHALASTTRGNQVDEVALSIWSMQTYKRYVRARLTESPQGVVDRLFVPPNMADTISSAVYNGRHAEAAQMIKELWTPFGLQGSPRLIVVLCTHRSDPNHWVVHRFSLPDGNLSTYDCYPERTLPDGRPLGWWFSIRLAWPEAASIQADNVVQKMVRLHRPLQTPIENSVAAAGIWRNILMGSRAERSLDLERLRDLINTEVKNLKQRKMLGKLTVPVGSA